MASSFSQCFEREPELRFSTERDSFWAPKYVMPLTLEQGFLCSAALLLAALTLM